MKRSPCIHFRGAAMSYRHYWCNEGPRRGYEFGRENNEFRGRSFWSHQHPNEPSAGPRAPPTPRQQFQHPRPPSRPAKPLDYREWEYAKLHPPAHCERFTVLSYNILADYLAINHRGRLYYHIPRHFLDWQWRKRSLSFELGLWSAHILCFQEVDKFKDLEEMLIPLGYSGIWKMRTGDPVDGCAIFWRTTRFKLLYEESIEFRKYGLRDNVAQICVLESTGCNRDRNESASTRSPKPYKKIVVCNIHVLFNPKRGEIKLGQVRELLQKADAVSKLWDEAPVILCGDFNSTPKSPLYNFIEKQKLDLSELPRDRVSGQTSTYIAPQIPSNDHGVHHLTGLAGDSLATSRKQPADVGSPQIAQNAGQANSLMNEPPKPSFAGRNEDFNESSLVTLKEKEQVSSDAKKDESSCDPADSGQITTVFAEGKSSYSASKISTTNPTTEESTLDNLSEVAEGGSKENEDIWQELSPANLPQVSFSEKLERSLPNVVIRGAHGESGSLDGAYRLQDGSSSAPNVHEVQVDLGEVNDMLDNTPVENMEDNGLEKFIYNPSAWTPEEMRTATGNADCKVVEHPMKLKSTYTEVEDNSGTRDSIGEPLVTSYHRRFQGTVDYIWRSEGLQTVRVLAPIPKSAMAWTPGFPTKKWGSDHIALVSELAFTEDCSAQNIGVQ